jgi:HAD superfamily hydrolase (TIGR01549 family)
LPFEILGDLIDTFLRLGARHKYVIFDYDSTIARVPINWPAARIDFRHYLTRTFPSLELPEELRVDEMEAFALAREPDQAERIFQYRVEIESQLAGAHELIEPTASLIDFLKSDGSYRLFIVSNNLHRTVEEGLLQFGFTDAFDVIIGVDDAQVPKPAVQAFDLLAQQAGIVVEASIFVGDNDRTDGGFCKRLGMTYLNINNLKQSEQ